MKGRNCLSIKKMIGFVTIIYFLSYEIVGMYYTQEVSAAVKRESHIGNEGFTQIDYSALTPSDVTNGNSEELLQYVTMEQDYRKLVTTYEKKGYAVNLSWDEYEETILQGRDVDIKSYLEKPQMSSGADFSIPQNSDGIMSSGGDGRSGYYYNTGTRRPSKCKYSKYYLLSKAKRGDIFYEKNGGKGISGHVGIVEGKFYEDSGYYIRIIEATPAYGVKRGVLDDTRADEGGVTLLRPIANNEAKKASVTFCISQLDKKYNLDLRKDYGKNEPDWYCSELVWAAYKNQGKDLETTGVLNEPGITPRDILRSSETSTIDIYHSSK